MTILKYHSKCKKKKIANFSKIINFQNLSKAVIREARVNIFYIYLELSSDYFNPPHTKNEKKKYSAPGLQMVFNLTIHKCIHISRMESLFLMDRAM